MRSNRRIGREVAKHEAAVAKAVGGVVQPASGALWGRKADVRSDLFLVEAKLTGNRSITVKAEWLEKVFDEATVAGKNPMLSLQLGGRRYFVIEEGEMADLLSRLES